MTKQAQGRAAHAPWTGAKRYTAVKMTAITLRKMKVRDMVSVVLDLRSGKGGALPSGAGAQHLLKQAIPEGQTNSDANMIPSRLLYRRSIAKEHKHAHPTHTLKPPSRYIVQMWRLL